MMGYWSISLRSPNKGFWACLWDLPSDIEERKGGGDCRHAGT